jgi:predicted nucleic acid-binding protein
MSRIYWDSMLFVYWIEDNPTYSARLQQLAGKMKERGDQLCTSSFAVGEILLGPYKKRAYDVVQKIRQFFRPPLVEIIPFTLEAADHYASIRATRTISPADAIHLACAAFAGTDLFLTNDRNLVGRVVPGIQFIAGLDSNII